MRFGNFQLAHFLWVVAAVAIFYVLAFKSRKSALNGFAASELLKDITQGLSYRRVYLRAALIVISVLLSIVALMRPQFGFHLEEVKRGGSDVLIAVDISKSMLATDVKPNRLIRSKLAVEGLVKKLKGDRVGLIGFAGRAFLFAPLTVDYNGFLLALNDLSVKSVPIGGTDIASAIDEAIKVYNVGGEKSTKEKSLILITDGEDLEGGTKEAAERAKAAGIKIYAVGIGTAEGELIQITDEKGGVSFLKDEEGNIVKSRLDEGTLEKIALATDGAYIKATGVDLGLDIIYEEKISSGKNYATEDKMERRYNEKFQYPLAAALLLLMIEALIGNRKRVL
ncbi:vWA domain-containing protein [Candidatus Magnetomonas plexicatena]|uniref:vWA domain-containing protein n=1 Tax=Candidatus Magnetomonas plexicatena TaxID=2552947 RepID=UPI001C765079|nr:VWA domain-containing protein [Nitrospirales bacterium LBB_01]